MEPQSRLAFATNKFSKKQLIAFAAAFALIGGYLLFRAFAASGTAYTVNSSITDGGTLSGTISWTISATPVPKEVNFYIDGVKDSRVELTAPYGYGGDAGTFDTTKLSNGAHTLQEIIIYQNSQIILTHNVTISNVAASNTFSTSVKEGGTFALPYAWTFSPGESSVAGYFYADGKLLQKITGAGPYKFTLAAGSLTAGVHKLGHAWDTPAGAHKTPATAYNVTVSAGTTTSTAPAPVPATTTNTSGWSGPWPARVEPSYTPNKIASTPAEFATIMAGLKVGDVVKVKPMIISGQVTLGQKLAAPGAEIHFDSGVKFTGAAAGSRLPTVWFKGSNLRLYGGEVTTANMGTNDCVRVQAGTGDTSGPTNLLWWGVKIHDCASNGFSAQGTNYPNTGLDIEAEVWNTGKDLSIDPHAEKGSGMHGAYIGGDAKVTSGKFVIYTHDQSTSAGGVQLGSNIQNSEVWVRAKNLNFVARQQTGANAVQFWGSNNSNVIVRNVEGINLQGRVVETDGTSYAGKGITIEYGRGTNTLLNSFYSKVNFYGAGINLGNVSPKP